MKLRKNLRTSQKNLRSVHVFTKQFQPSNLKSDSRNFVVEINSLSFYGSQNILGWSKLLCAIPKTDLHILPVLNFLCQTKKWFSYISRSHHQTTNFPNSESWIFTTKFCLLAWSTVGRDTLQFIYWNQATFSNSF